MLEVSESFLTPAQIESGWRMEETGRDFLELTHNGHHAGWFTQEAVRREVQLHVAEAGAR